MLPPPLQPPPPQTAACRALPRGTAAHHTSHAHACSSTCAPAAHTLGNALRDVMWSHPHIQLASYTQEHPSSADIILRCQTSGPISAEQGVAEALMMTQEILHHVGDTMAAAAAAWAAAHPEEQQQGGGGEQQAAEAEAAAGEEEPMEEDSGS